MFLGLLGYNSLMSSNFWHQIKKPILGLSPMDGITDSSFRYIQKKYGSPDVIYTEFATVEGLCRNAIRPLDDLIFDESQRPIVAQIYGKTPDFFRQTAIMVCELGFGGVDINMGCPAKNVAHSGSGAALIQTPELAQAIVKATQIGVEEWVNGKTVNDCPDISARIKKQVKLRHQALPTKYQQHSAIPVSIKTRIGYSQPSIDTWLPTLLETKPAVIAVHGRTLKQQYGGQADWSMIAKAKEIAKDSGTLILGNGDVKDYHQATELCTKYNLDGVLIGRHACGNPFVFKSPNMDDHISIFIVALDHATKHEAGCQNQNPHSFMPMRKHLSWYIKGISQASEIRAQLVTTNSALEVASIFEKYGLLSRTEIDAILGL